MSGDELAKPNRPALPRDGFRAQRAHMTGAPAPVVITPDYEDPQRPVTVEGQKASPPAKKPERTQQRTTRDPLRVYGERSSSRPYALRLPDSIDRVLRHIAAEERTQPLRIIDRAIYDYLKKIGRLPPADDV